VRGLIALALTHPAAVADPYVVADAVLSGEFGTGKLTFPTDEPLFLLRGQDALAPGIVREYAVRADDPSAVSEQHRRSAWAAADEFADWQAANPGRTKIPD
jgi:hypothetical protein